MTPSPQPNSITQSLENPLDRALVGFMKHNEGAWIDPDTIMRKCGFDDPKRERVGAYAQFYNSLLRANAVLAPHGFKIRMSEDGENIYSMGRADECR